MKENRKIIKLKCATCNNDIVRPKNEFDRQTRKGRTKFYCDSSCAYKANPAAQAVTEYVKSHPKEAISRMAKNLNGENPHKDDEFSSFRYFINKSKAKERVKNYGVSNLTVEYLKKIWENQGGICPYTGIEMELPKNTQDYHIKGKPHKASLDRIDSSIGYVEGNVEFVCLSVNYAKNGFSREDMIDFFGKIKFTLK